MVELKKKGGRGPRAFTLATWVTLQAPSASPPTHPEKKKRREKQKVESGKEERVKYPRIAFI